MKLLKYLPLALGACCVFFYMSCSKDNSTFENSDNTSLTKRSRSGIRSDADANEVLTIASKLIAQNLANKANFKEELIPFLFSEDGIPNRHLFLKDVLGMLDRNAIDNVSQVGSSSINSFDALISKVTCDYPLMVVKVPDFSTMVWNEGPVRFDYNVAKELNFKMVAFNEDENRIMADAYSYEGDKLTVIDMNVDKNLTYVPIFVRFSEYHRVVDPITLIDRFGVSIVEDDLFYPTDSPCNPEQIFQAHVVGPVMCESYSGDVIVDWFDFIWDYRSKDCPEICDNGIDDDGDGYIDELNSCLGVLMLEDCTNGIDDDGDGLIDCEDDDCCGVATCDPCENMDEICDNGIDDDGDGAIDEDDADCCNFYASCLRDCAIDQNYIEGLKIVSHLTSAVVNENILYYDVGHVKLVFYQFGGSGPSGPSVTPNVKTLPFKFLTDCYNKLANDLELRQHLFNAEIGCQPDENGSIWSNWTVLWVPFHPDCIYLNITSTSPIIQRILWDNEWNGAVMGEEVRCNIWFEDTKAVNISGGTSQTINTSFSTTSGGSFGTNGTVNTGGTNAGSSNSTTTGYMFSNMNGGGTSMQSSFSYSITSVARDLGNVDLHYCDTNEDIDVDLGCGGFPEGVWNYKGKSFSTGTAELFTSIEIE